MLAMGAAGVLLAGCATDADADTGGTGGTGLPAAFDRGVPTPTGEVVLTLTVAGAEVAWDIATLELLEQHTLTMFEPFIEADRTFTGPWLRDVLLASGADLATTSEVEFVALDQFVAVIPTTERSLDGALLATTDGGAPIGIADGGPLRLVFAEGNPTAENLNNWIWSIVTGEVR